MHSLTALPRVALVAAMVALLAAVAAAIYLSGASVAATTANAGSDVALLTTHESTAQPSASESKLMSELGVDPASVRFAQRPSVGSVVWLGRRTENGDACFILERSSGTGVTCNGSRTLSDQGVIPLVTLTEDGSQLLLAGIVPDGIETASLGALETSVVNNTFTMTAPRDLSAAVVTLGGQAAPIEFDFGPFLPEE